MFLAEHHSTNQLHHVEYTLLVDSDDSIILFFGHPEQQAVLGNTSVVDQSVNAAELLLNSLDHFFTLCIICNIRRKQSHFYTVRTASFSDFFSVCLIPIAWIVIDSDIVTVFCKTFCDTSTDALRCTGNQCGCHRRNHPFCVSCLSVEQRFSLSHHFLNHFCTRLHIVYHAGNQTAQERAFFDVAVHNCLSQ